VPGSIVHHPRAEPVARILVVQTAFLGDVVLTVPLLQELRRAQPEARVTLLTTATGHDLLSGSPYVDRCLVLDKRWDREGRRSCRILRRELTRERYDAAVAAHRSVRTGVIVRLSGARLRVGFAGAPGAWAYNRRIRWDADKHAVRRYLELSGVLGGTPEAADPRPRLSIDPVAAERAEALLFAHGIRANDGLLCVAPGSVWPTKRWLPEGFARVVAAAPRRGLVPVLIGSPDERELCRRVAALAPAPVLAGETSIPDVVALLARARMVVANDSGAAHVASAVDTPVVSVFGSTAPQTGYTAFGRNTRVVQHPNLPCRPCGRHGSRSCPAGHFRCMTEVRAAWVLDQIDELLAATDRPARKPALPMVARGREARRAAVQPRVGVAPG
jgi:heptosyltransferase-2